jgi:tetratricopeptide (TPR) repeat protein
VLGWATVGVVLMLVSLVAYAFLSGVFVKDVPPRTAQEDALAATAASIAQDPSNGAQYAIRAEALYGIGDKTEAFKTLDAGEAAVGGKNPALLYILRARTALLNLEHRYADAVKVGQRAMIASDEYLRAQGVVLVQKGISVVGGNTQTRVSVDTALQVAQAYMGLKEYDKAIELYDYALRLEPTAADVVSMRGWAHLEKGDKVKARSDFQQALEYVPDDPYATSGMKELSD